MIDSGDYMKKSFSSLLNGFIKFYSIQCRRVNLWLFGRAPQKELLFSVWDLQVCPTTFDFINFLCHVEAERSIRGYQSFQVIIVPGLVDGFRDANSYSIDNKRWRVGNILLPLANLQASCSGVYQCASREEAFRVIGRISKKQILPINYSVENPISFYSWKETFSRIDKQQNLQTLRSRSEPRKIVKNWLLEHARGRKIVTVTLRESAYETERNSNVPVWKKFIQSLNKGEICPIILRDQDKSLVCDESWKEAGALTLEPAIWNVELRQALYEYANVNFFINNGPFVMAVMSENIRYAVFKMVTEDIFVTSSRHLIKNGWRVGDHFPASGLAQRLYWEDETLEKLTLACRELLDLPEELILDGFDGGFYRLNTALTAMSEADLFDHYRANVRSSMENPNAWFEEKWYRKNYLNVNVDVDDGIYESGFEHFLLIGKSKGNRPNAEA